MRSRPSFCARPEDQPHRDGDAPGKPSVTFVISAISTVSTTPERSRLMALAREAKQNRAGGPEFDDLAIASLIGLEVEAKKITSYESSVVPWAFQTEEYARAVIKGSLGPHIEDRILAERVTARMTRQELLRSTTPPYLWFLIDEAALRRVVGGIA